MSLYCEVCGNEFEGSQGDKECVECREGDAVSSTVPPPAPTSSNSSSNSQPNFNTVFSEAMIQDIARRLGRAGGVGTGFGARMTENAEFLQLLRGGGAAVPAGIDLGQLLRGNGFGSSPGDALSDEQLQAFINSTLNNAANNNHDNGSESSGNNGTSKAALAKIPRIRVAANSSLLMEATIEIEGIEPIMAIAAEFGKHPDVGSQTIVQTAKLKLVPASPIHGTPSATPLSNSSELAGSMAFFRRGGDVTFAQKALNAVENGASAVVVANDCGIWPYVMTDSTGEGAGVDVPVVMIKRSDGSRMLKKITEQNDGFLPGCVVKIRRFSDKEKSCPICLSEFDDGDIVIRLPFCNHVFHENCGVRWLEGHNTCPECRREMPWEDSVKESERRRRGSEYAGSEGVGNVNNGWEDIFG